MVICVAEWLSMPSTLTIEIRFHYVHQSENTVANIATTVYINSAQGG